MLTKTVAVCIALLGVEFSTAQEPIELRLPPGVDPGVVVGLHKAPQPPQDKAMRHSDDASSPAAVPGSKEALIQKKLGEVDQLQREIQQLQADSGSHQQVVVRLQMLEVSLTKLRKMGMEVASLSDGNFKVTDAAGLKKAMSAMGAAHSSASDEDVDSANANAVVDFTNWLERNNVANVLARPTIAVVSGRPASFFAGEELPLPPGPDPKAALNFHRVGTELDLTATVRDNHHVRLEIRTKVSERDEAHALVINGSNVPALKVRQFCTTVDATFNEPVVFSGLLDKRQITEKTGDGHVKDFENETVLLVVAIPELCEPLVGTQPSTAQNR